MSWYHDVTISRDHDVRMSVMVDWKLHCSESCYRCMDHRHCVWADRFLCGDNFIHSWFQCSGTSIVCNLRNRVAPLEEKNPPCYSSNMLPRSVPLPYKSILMLFSTYLIVGQKLFLKKKNIVKNQSRSFVWILTVMGSFVSPKWEYDNAKFFSISYNVFLLTQSTCCGVFNILRNVSIIYTCLLQDFRCIFEFFLLHCYCFKLSKFCLVHP